MEGFTAGCTFLRAELPRLRHIADISADQYVRTLAAVGITLVFVVGAVNPHFLHSGLQRGALHTQSGSSTMQTRDHAAGFP